MIVYVDSSVLMRKVLTTANSLGEWDQIERFVSSALLSVECARTLHRLRVFEPLGDDEFARRLDILRKALAPFELVGLDPVVLDRASEAFVSPLKTLDAIHLATAVLWKERENATIRFATHDKQLGIAASILGLPVLGL